MRAAATTTPLPAAMPGLASAHRLSLSLTSVTPQFNRAARRTVVTATLRTHTYKHTHTRTHTHPHTDTHTPPCPLRTLLFAHDAASIYITPKDVLRPVD